MRSSKYDFAIKTLYAARRPLLSQLRLNGLGDTEACALESIQSSIDVLEMMEHFRVQRSEKS